MITSIVLTDKYNVGVNSNNKIKLDGHLLSLTDIPFVRYRFSKYTDEELSFIKLNKEKFKGPIHLAEVMLDENSASVLTAMDSIEGLAKFLYVTVTDFDIANGLNENAVSILSNLGDAYYDRIVIKDKTSMMYPLAAAKLMTEIEKLTGFKSYDIGMCGSTLSFRTGDEEGKACLTAVWARRIMAEYADTADIVIPTAGHECMNCCGCIQYITVSSNVEAPIVKSKGATAKEPTIKAEKGESVPKQVKPKGIPSWAAGL